ncbi:MAG: hypothetical protein R6U08_08095 [Bacillota bacterium]
MRKTRRKSKDSIINHYWLWTFVCLLALLMITINCSLDQATYAEVAKSKTDETVLNTPELSKIEDKSKNNETAAWKISEEMWADVTESLDTPRATNSYPSKLSLDLKNASILDVFSLLAYKLSANIIYLEQPTEITLKTHNLSPMTTLQIILQKEGLDFLTVGNNYIVGQRERLYSDFFNRMLLTCFNLNYVSAEKMQSYLSELGVPVQSLTVEANQQAIWMQGTPIALGKARELINSLDIMDNAEFARGGARKIRMPVAKASGTRAEEELEALVDMLSILLDGFRDGRTDMGWVTWDHPDPIPYITMDWDNPVIKPYDIKMKITRDFAGDYSNQIRYLIAEGTPANIKLVEDMIQKIEDTKNSPLVFGDISSEDYTNDNTGNDNDTANNNDTVTNDNTNNQQEYPIQQAQYLPSYTVKLSAVPPEGGDLSGADSYSQDSMVTVTATPATGYDFVRWIENGAELSTSLSYTFVIYGNRSLEAVFITSDNDNDNDSESNGNDEDGEG